MAGAGSFTNTLAVSVFPVPPLVEPTVTELVFKPVVVPVTLTTSVQDAPAAKLTPVKLTVDEPAVAVAAPPHVFDKPLGVATTRPAGSESVKFTPVRVVAVLGLLMENVSAVELPVKMGFAVNTFWMTGGATTVRDEAPYPVDVVFGPVCVELIFPLIFVYAPATLPKTLIDIVQLALVDRVPPLTVMVDVPAVAVIVAPVNVPAEQD